MAFWIYILKCADGSYYTGHTDALEQRLTQHHQGAITDCYTLARRPLELVYSQDFPTRDEAFRAERQVKGWRRGKKEALIAHHFDLLPSLARTARLSPVQEGSAQMLHPRSSKGVLRQAQDERVLRRAQDERNLEEVDLNWMRHALSLAGRAEQQDDEIPVGAVLLGPGGSVLGEGWNRNIGDCDPSAHAEIVAMREAGRRLGNHRLVGCSLYATLEPCAMCAMAMVHARIQRLVFAACDPKTGAAGSVFDLLSDPRHNHRVQVYGGVLAAEAGAMLSAWFQRRRRR